jgi:hypothetical protein
MKIIITFFLLNLSFNIIFSIKLAGKLNTQKMSKANKALTEFGLLNTNASNTSRSKIYLI